MVSSDVDRNNVKITHTFKNTSKAAIVKIKTLDSKPFKFIGFWLNQKA